MSLRACFDSPRRWLALFLLITLLPSILLICLGWRSLRQDQALALQAVQDRREQATDLIVSSLQQSLAAAEQALAAPESLGAMVAPEGALTVALTSDGVAAFPRERLLYYPVPPPRPEAPPKAFAAVEDLEFRLSDYPAAARALLPLAQSPDPAVRAGALIRLARNLRKNGQTAVALAAYDQAAAVRDVSVEGVPADLLARWARCDLLSQLHRDTDLHREAAALSADLTHARWPLTRAAYESHLDDVRRWLGDPAADPPASALALAGAVEWLWSQHQRAPLPARELVPIDGLQITVISRGDRALLIMPGYVQRQWLDKLGPLTASQHVNVTLPDRAARPAAKQSRRTTGETGLPWTVAVESVGLREELERAAGRRTLWLAGLGVLAALVTAGTYVIARAMARELAVARLQSDFVSAVSHEFRTPLTSLRQLTEILSEGRIAGEDRRRSYYQALQRQTERLHRLVESLLDFGRMEAGASPYRMEPLDACALVRTVTSEFAAEVSASGYHVESDIDSVRVSIAGDREALANALWNLLDNAVKYSPESRTVWVDVERVDRRLAIHVRDHGLGIPAAEQEDIFHRFVRGAAARAEGIKGTGIGLAMVRHIMKAHGGEVRLTSQPGAGSTFTLLLPIEEAEVEPCPAS